MNLANIAAVSYPPLLQFPTDAHVSIAEYRENSTTVVVFHYIDLFLILSAPE